MLNTKSSIIKVSSDSKTKKDLLLAKLMQLTQDKWNRQFNDDSSNKPWKKVNNVTKGSCDELSISLFNSEVEHTSTLNSGTVKKLFKFRTEHEENITTDKNNADLVSTHVKQGVCNQNNKKQPREKLPFIKEIMLKTSIGINQDKQVFSCEKCKIRASTLSPKRNKSFTSFCVRHKIQFFENIRHKADSNRFLVNIYNSNDGIREWLDETELQAEEAEICSAEVTLVNESEHSTSTDCDKEQALTEETVFEVKCSHPPTLDSTGISTDYDQLMDNINLQCILMAQAAKALHLCYQRQQIYDNEFIEAQRILLTSGNKRQLLVNKLRSNSLNNNDAPKVKSTARISLTNLRFPLRVSANRYRCRTWYVALFSYDEALYATDWIEMNPNRNYVCFPESFVFENVSPNFIVTVDLFQMQISKSQFSNRLSCITLNNNRVRGIFQTLTYRDVYSGKKEQLKIPLTLFRFSAQFQITKDSLQGNQVHFLNKVSNNCLSLDGTAYLHADIANLEMNEDFCGFLTVGTELFGRIVWDRKWARLVNNTLCFWEYPSEEDNHTPKLTINLKSCVDGEIEIAGKDLCSRSRTLIIRIDDREVNDSTSLNATTYHITADTIQDMEVWRKRLNGVLKSLKLWQ